MSEETRFFNSLKVEKWEWWIHIWCLNTNYFSVYVKR